MASWAPSSYVEGSCPEFSVKESPDVGHAALGLVANGVVVVALGGHVVQAAPVESGQLDHQLV